MDKLKLYLDEDITDTLARVLRAKGYDVTSSHEVGMNGQADETQLEYASKQQRAMLTFNIAHFTKLAEQWKQERKEHWGIIVSPQIDFKTLIRLTTNLLQRVQSSQMRRRIDWLQNYR